MADYTREQPKEVSLPVRLPLVGIPNQRAGSAFQDSRLINGYVEMGQDNVFQVVKRPGLVPLYTCAGRGVGLFNHLAVFSVPVEGGYSNKLYFDGTLSNTFASDAVASEFFSFCEVSTGAESSVTLLHDRRYIFTYDDAGTLDSIPFQGVALGTLTCTITNGSAVVSTASTAALMPYAVVTGAGIPANTMIDSINSGAQFTLSANATASTVGVALTFVAGGPPARVGVASASTLANLVYGAASLNKSTYLFNYQKLIAGSDIDDPTAWNPLNRIYAYAEQDAPVALAKQLSYLVAFKAQSTEFFRDVGSSPGSPLERLEGLKLAVGCYDGRLISDIDGQLIWMSFTESGLKSVWSLQNAKAEEIAWPSIRRILQILSPTSALSFSIAGHSFYILTDPAAGVSLVYDLTSKYWSYWSALGETYFPFVAATHNGSTTLLQHESNGIIYELSPDAVTDAGSAFDMDIYPPQFDANMRTSKYVARMYAIADQATDSVLQVRSSDSDQTAGSWSNFREFDLSKPRPDLYDCGSFTKRFYHFRHSSATACRLVAVEMDLLPGTL